MELDEALPESVERILETVTIPTLPAVVQKINALLQDPDAGMPEIAALVMQDAAIAAKVLRMANSSYYGLSAEVVSIQQAATVLGAKVLKSIALQASVIAQYDHLELSEHFDPRHVWKHAVLAAQTCQRLGEASSLALPLDPHEFYTCGLVHDIGKIVMLDSVGDEYLEVVRDCRADQGLVDASETKAFGFHHGEVGAMVAAEWQLPRPVVESIRFHHGPQEQVQDNPHVLLVSLGDRIANAAASTEWEHPERVAEPDTCARLGIEEPEAREIIERAAEGWPTIDV